jgi:thymidine phosphorylase
VESIPLITASILSTKLAEGIDGLVMDVKTGAGALMPELKQAGTLARSLMDVCGAMKTRIAVLISDMEQPLGHAVGNAIEVRECIHFLKGSGPEDLESLSLALAAHMILLGGKAKNLQSASRMAYEAVSRGSALERFRAIVQAQGGDPRVVDDPSLLPLAKNVRNVHASKGGFVRRCDAKLLGLAANALGAGRSRVGDFIDPEVGLYLEKKIGDRVRPGDTLCRIYWNDTERLRDAENLVNTAFQIGSRPVSPPPLIHATLVG